MMKHDIKNTIVILSTILVLFSLSACDDWLGVVPEDGVIRQEFWKTKEEAHAALMGCYASMLDEQVVLRYFLWGELRADFISPTSRANNDIIAIRDGEIAAVNQYAKWEHFYKTINYCNTVIEMAPSARAKDLSFTDRELRQYIAEAVCVRSLAYFYLLRTFRDVPYVTKASIYDDQKFTVPKISQSEILENLVSDLVAVEDDLAYSFNNLIETKGRFTVWGLKALLADIYLWKGDYQKCTDVCTQIIESGQFSLLPITKEESTAIDNDGEVVPVYFANRSDISVLFDKMYVQGNSTESILELQFNSEKGNPFVQWHKPVSGYLSPKTEDINRFFPSSELDRGWRDIRVEYAWRPEAIWKWIGLSLDGDQFRADNESFSNWVYYRLPDIMLMKAEALTQMAYHENDDQVKLQQAKELVEEIRVRANATERTGYAYIYGESLDGSLDSKSLEEYILNERAREFAFEGKRWFDILRYIERNDYANIDYLAELAIHSTIPEKVSVLQNKWLNNKGSHYLPIYSEEIRMNKELEQNEFYK